SAMRPASGSAPDGRPGAHGYDAFEAATRTWAGMREIAQAMLIASDTNVRATLDCAENLARAEDPSAFVAVQARFFKEQSARLTQQMIDLQQTTDRVARDLAPAKPDAP
ncbi:phasin family protein, partial [Methylobacterium trifolii]